MAFHAHAETCAARRGRGALSSGGLIRVSLLALAVAVISSSDAQGQAVSVDIEITNAPSRAVPQSVGDVNGDGKDDVLINNQGGVTIVFGRGGGSSVDLTALGTGGYHIAGAGSGGDPEGGDINNDGLDDLLLTPRPGPYQPTVVFGKAGTADQDISQLGSGGFEIGPIETESLCSIPCRFVDGLGDVNGDGRADIVVGEPAADLVVPIAGTHINNAGRIYVIYGKTDASAVDVDQLDAGDGYTLSGTLPDQELGKVVAGLGDVNGDGRGDIATMARARGFVLFGNSGDASIPGAGDIGFDGYSIDHSVVNLDGTDIQSAGDINDDGWGDVVLSSRNTAYVLYGKSSTDAINLRDVDLGVDLHGYQIQQPRRDLGCPPCAREIGGLGTGDFDGDSRDDILIGDGFGQAAIIAYGQPFPGRLDLCQLGSAAGSIDAAARALMPAGDFNGDGNSDIIAGPTDTGSDAVVWFGRSSLSPVASCLPPGPGGVEDQVFFIRLDTTEHWVPIDVEAFLSEDFTGDTSIYAPDEDSVPFHRACPGVDPLDGDPTCDPIHSVADLARSSEYQHLDIHGNPDTDSDYHQPGEPSGACLVPTFYDCPSTARYRQTVTRTGDPYFYVDFWWFFRFDSSQDAPPIVVFSHEGDWEGITLAVDKTNTVTFDYAVFAAHDARWRYLRDVLRCPATKDGSCGSAFTLGGTNSTLGPDVYVANGTHASYPQPCSAGCSQTNESGTSLLPESSFDGTWEPDILTQDFDPAWNDFPGRWGTDSAEPGTSPRSPAAQGRFQQPWESSCTTRWSSSDCSATATASVGSCNQWFGPGTTATFCDPKTLAAGLSAGLSRDLPSRRFSASIGDKSQTAGARNGIAQVAGNGLSVGEELIMRGFPEEAVLMIRGRDHGRLVEARFPAPDPHSPLAVRFLGLSGGFQLRQGKQIIAPTDIKLLAPKR